MSKQIETQPVAVPDGLHWGKYIKPYLLYFIAGPILMIVEVLGEEKMTLAEYQEILEAGFAEASVGIIPPTADQVLIGDNERSRLKDIRVLFFVGVNDGLIPRHDAGGGILSEYDREELERADAKLSPTARETMYQQKFHLYRNLTKPSERLYLSFAKAGASGEAQNPSDRKSVV